MCLLNERTNAILLCCSQRASPSRLLTWQQRCHFSPFEFLRCLDVFLCLARRVPSCPNWIPCNRVLDSELGGPLVALLFCIQKAFRGQPVSSSQGRRGGYQCLVLFMRLVLKMAGGMPSALISYYCVIVVLYQLQQQEGQSRICSSSPFSLLLRREVSLLTLLVRFGTQTLVLSRNSCYLIKNHVGLVWGVRGPNAFLALFIQLTLSMGLAQLGPCDRVINKKASAFKKLMFYPFKSEGTDNGNQQKVKQEMVH